MKCRRTRLARLVRATASAMASALLFAFAMGRPTAAAPQQPRGAPDPDISSRVQAECLAFGDARVSRNLRTGAVRLVGTEPGRPIPHPRPADAAASPEAAARSYLSVCASLFGLEDAATDLVVMKTVGADRGRSVVRFQQRHHGIQVIGAELLVHIDDKNNVLTTVGKTLPKTEVDVVATFDAAAAITAALDTVSKNYDIDREDLVTTAPLLWIYSPSLIGPFADPSRLVWRVEVSSRGLAPIRELVLVDAHRGSVALQFNQIETVLSRRTYTAGHTTVLPGTLVCGESNPSCAGGDTDAIYAHLYAADTYNFYLNTLGRNSIDNAGMTITSSVHYAFSSPNAAWFGNLNQIAYSDGYSVADDVVGHELTHGVTQYTSGLFPYYQSGAINESLSDVFGELIDQSNGHGNDTAAVRWRLGEDLPGGAIRNMANPAEFGDPDKMTSPNYSRDVLDNGGIHQNTGVNNKAAYLMVDGGTFNGQSVSGLGITKVAKIYYEVQTHLLTSGSDYGDLYDALYQGCNNLVGTAFITSADCQQVRNATIAVEMNLQPAAGYNTDAAICSAPALAADVFFDNLESGNGKWVAGALSGTNRWVSTAGYAHSGLYSLYADDFPAQVSDSYAAMASGVVVPSNGYLHFSHAFGFDNPNWDGGVVEYSTNGGASWIDAGTLFEANGYRGPIAAGFGNPLGGRAGFIGDSHGYISSRLNLAGLAGQTVRFRWRMGLDSVVYNLGWLVDDVRIYRCITPTVTATPGTVTTGAMVTVTVGDGPGNPRDWVGLFRAGASDSVPTSWVYLSGTQTPPPTGLTSAIVQLVAPATLGAYNVRSFVNDSYTKLATSGTITVEAPPATVTVVSPTVNGGDDILFSVANGPASTTDWVGLFPAAAADAAYISWAYLNGTMTAPSTGVSGASLRFTAPLGGGTYNIRLFANNSMTKLATSGIVTVPIVPTLTINDISTAEGNTGTSTATFTVTLSPTSTQTVTVNFATANGTATAGSDYTATAGTLTFAPGTVTQTIAVSIIGDTTYEPDETFTVNLTGANAFVGDAQGLGTIVNDDVAPPISIALSSASVSPGGTISFTVANGPGNRMDWVTLSSTASADSAYLSWMYLNGTQTPPASGVAGATLQFPAPLIPGAYNIRLFANNGLTKLVTSATVTVVGPSVTTLSSTVPVGAPIVLDVANGPGNRTDWVALAPTGAADAGYLSWNYLNGSHTAPATGVTNATLQLIAPSTAGTYNIRLFASDGMTKLATSGSITVQSPPALTVNDISVMEGDSGVTTATFTVTLTPASTQTVTVNYATANGTATADVDYAATAGTVTFAAGTTVQTIGVSVNGDTTYEPNETFVVNLSNPTNAVVIDAQGVGTILNDDAAPPVSITLSSSTASPGGMIGFTVTNGPGNPRDWVTLSSTASADAAYLSWMYLNGMQTAPASGVIGATLQFVAPTTPGTYNIRFFANNGLTKLATSGSVTVAPPTLTVTSATVLAGASVGFTVTNGPGNRTDWVALVPAAAADNAYVSWVYLNGTHTTPLSGVTDAVLQMTAPTAPGAYNLRLFANDGIVKLATSGTVTVQPAPTLTVNDVSLLEGNSGVTTATFTITLMPASTQTVTVNYATADGTATAGVDYTATAGTLTFAPGTMVQTIGVAVNGDTTFEPNEMFVVNLSNATNAVIGDAQGVGTIVNEDGAAPPSVTLSSSTATPGGIIEFTLANGPANPTDWVGLVPTGAGDLGYVMWQYLNGMQTPPASGVIGATLQFMAPTTPGTYNVRFFANDGFTKLATSGTMTVAPWWDPLESTCRHASLSIL